MFGFIKEAQRRRMLDRIEREYAILANKVERISSHDAARKKHDSVCREKGDEAGLGVAIELVDIAVNTEPQSLFAKYMSLKNEEVFGVPKTPPIEDPDVSKALVNAHGKLVKIAIMSLGGLYDQYMRDTGQRR